MAFEGLSDKLNNAFKKLRTKGRLTEPDVKEKYLTSAAGCCIVSTAVKVCTLSGRRSR